MSRQIASLSLGVLVLCAIGFILFYLMVHTARFITSLDQPLIVAILAASATVLAATITVVVGKIFERNKEIEAHFRQKKFDHYYEMLTLISDLTRQVGPASVDADVVKRLSDWQRNLILFAGPKTIRCFVAWFGNLKSGALTLRTIMLMEEFYKSLRSDLGISNLGLKDGDLAHLWLRHGDLYVSMLQKNPNMPLSDLITLERQREAAASSSGAAQSS